MEIFIELKKFFQNRSLILRMALRDITDRYAGSAFGTFWTLIQPLFIIAVYVFVFTFVFKVRIGGNGSPTDYALYAIAGLLPWLAFAEGISKSVSSVYAKSPLVKQAIFPIEILPLSSVLSSFVPLSVGLLFYILVSLFLKPEHLILIFILPVVMAIHLTFMAGLGYFLATIGVYFRDLSEIVTMFLTIGMFVTPILYLENAVPHKLAWIINLNPITHLINIYRDVIFYGSIKHPWSFLICLVLSVLLFVSGVRTFKKVKHLFSNVL